MIEQLDEHLTPPLDQVKLKLAELTAKNLPSTTSANIFRSRSPSLDGSVSTVGSSANDSKSNVTMSAHRARMLRSHFQKHYNDVHSTLLASEPAAVNPTDGTKETDGSLSVLGSLQQFNFFSYFIPSIDSTAQLDSQQLSSRSDEVVGQQQSLPQSLSPSTSSLSFATSPTYIIPAQTPPPPVPLRRPLIPKVTTPRTQGNKGASPVIPPTNDNLSWVPQLRPSVQMSPSQRKEKFLQAQNHVDVTVSGGSTDGSSKKVNSKSVLINLTPMKSYKEGGSLVGAPLTIAPGESLNLDKLLMTASVSDNVVDNDDVEDDDDDDDTKVVVDFAMNVFRDETHPGSSFPILSPRRQASPANSTNVVFDSFKNPGAAFIDTKSPGAVSSLINRFEKGGDASSRRKSDTALNDDRIPPIHQPPKIDQLIPSLNLQQASDRHRIAVLESVSEKLSLVVDHLLSRPLQQQASTIPSNRTISTVNSPSHDDLYLDVSMTLDELRRTLSNQPLSHSPSADVVNMSSSAPVLEPVSASLPISVSGSESYSGSVSGSGVFGDVIGVEPENTQIEVPEFLPLQVESLRQALENEKENSSRLFAALQDARDELLKSQQNLVVKKMDDMEVQTDDPTEKSPKSLLVVSSFTQTESRSSSSSQVQTDTQTSSSLHSVGMQSESADLLTTAMQTETHRGANVGSQTVRRGNLVSCAVQTDSKWNDETLSELRAALLQEQQDRLVIDLRNEELLIEADRKRAYSQKQLEDMRVALDTDKDSMDQLARDLENTFETLALTLIEISLEREKKNE